MSIEGHHLITTDDGSEISLLVDGVELYSATSIEWTAKQAKKFIRSLGRKKYKKPLNRGTNVIGVERGDLEVEFTIELKELNAALLEEVVQAERSGQTELKTTLVAGQAVENLFDLRNLTVLIQPPVRNGVRKPIEFFGVEFTEDSGSVKIGEAPGRKLSAIAEAMDGAI